MLFNSVAFLIFLPLVFLLYWYVFAKHVKARNLFLLVASYVFYGWWDWRFLALIFASSLVDYWIGLGFEQSDNQRQRKWLLFGSIAANIGALAFFKYYNFFYDSLVHSLNLLGFGLNYTTLKIILPVGISFYTFQTLSYTIDRYKGKIPVERDPIAFFAFVSFFPQLVAGPIERAKDLLPQFRSVQGFDYALAKDGLRMILWGLFKKVVVSDTLIGGVSQAFLSPADQHGSYLVLAAIYFAIIVYCDFSGYSEIAIGTAKLFGFRLSRNFAYPFFARNFRELWRRWHISLTSWFKDYIYIPLGGSKKGRWIAFLNTIIVFTISGLWHGANWNYVAWGFCCGVAFLPTLLFRTPVQQGVVAMNRRLPSLKEALQMLLTFGIFVFLFTLFFEQTFKNYQTFMGQVFSTSLFKKPPEFHTWYFVVGFLVVEFYNRSKTHGLDIARWPLALRWGTYFTLTMFILANYSYAKPFVYFQF